MERRWAKDFIFLGKLRDYVARVGLLCSVLFLVACKGVISSEIISTKKQINQPTFSGQTNASFTSTSLTYTVNGECDTNSKGTEWSLDQSTWTDLGKCTSGTFSFNVTVTGTIVVYARAKTSSGVTAASQASITYMLPPTTMQFSFVNAGYQGHETLGQADMQYGVENTMTAVTLSNANGQVIQSSVVDTIYEQ